MALKTKKHSPNEITSSEDKCEYFLLNMYKPFCVHKTSAKHECNPITGYMKKKQLNSKVVKLLKIKNARLTSCNNSFKNSRIDVVLFSLLLNLKYTEQTNRFKPNDAFNMETSHFIYSANRIKWLVSICNATMGCRLAKHFTVVFWRKTVSWKSYSCGSL